MVKISWTEVALLSGVSLTLLGILLVAFRSESSDSGESGDSSESGQEPVRPIYKIGPITEVTEEPGAELEVDTLMSDEEDNMDE